MSIEKQLAVEKDEYAKSYVKLQQVLRDPKTANDYWHIQMQLENLQYCAKKIAITLEVIEVDVTP
jgi:hypothetical protein